MAIRQKVLFWGLIFLLGIFGASSGWSFYWVFLLAGVGALIFWRFRKEKKGALLVVGTLVGLGLGFFYYSFYINFTERNQNIVLDRKINFAGVVTKTEMRDTYQKLILELTPPDRGTVMVLAKPAPNFEYGDLLRMEGEIRASQFVNQPPTVAFPKIEVEAKDQGFWLKAELYKFKNHLTAQFKKYLNADQAALVSGITFGERAEFNKDLKNDMARSGVTHIVALSGYNIAVLVLAIERSLKKLMARRKRFYLTLAIIFLFVLMVGGEASVVRAAIMGALILLAQHIGRPHDALHIIMLTALGMVLVNPTLLAYDIGFQLSFLSLLGIIFLEPALRRIFKVETKKGESFLAWRENGLTTMAAQLAVIPVLIHSFNQFSLTAVVSNALILVTVPLAMFLGFLLVTLSSISFFLGFLAAKLVSILAFYQISIIKIFSVIYIPLPGGQFLNSGIVFVVYYALLIWLVLLKQEKVPTFKKINR
ncbi:MAG: ComEC/Rec2 family competence protein [Candidatus Liptonbacteria bacterium]|nr:ComEC/Rec2 family competence protein [Candidatus Liptonbacteria bacterium]